MNITPELKALPKITLGMQIFVDYRNNAKDKRLETVAKVGRKWAELSGGRRIDLVSWVIDHDGVGYCPEVYQSEQHYIYCIELKSAWQKFKRDIEKVGYGVPNGVTVLEIQKARELLKMGEQQ